MPRKVKKYAPGEKRPRGRRADGRLSTKLTIGHDANGKPVYKWAYGYTKAELQAAVEEIKKTYISGFAAAADRDILFGVYAEQWYKAYIAPKNLSAGGNNTYLTPLNAHILPAFGDRQIRAIRPIEIQNFLNAEAAKGISKAVVDKIYFTLKRIFRTACGQYIIDRDPMLTVEKPAAYAGKRRTLTEAERKAVLAVATTHPDGLLLSLLYYTGMRLGEVLGLQWQDIDFKKREITVSRDIDFMKTGGDYVGNLKTPSAYRIIPIAQPLYAALWPVKGLAGVFVLQGRNGSHYTKTEFQTKWTDLMIAVYKQDNQIESRPVPEGYRALLSKEVMKQRESVLTPHYFRHNFATLLYDANVDIITATKIFGHKNHKILLDIYTDLSEKKRRESFKNIDQIF